MSRASWATAPPASAAAARSRGWRSREPPSFWERVADQPPDNVVRLPVAVDDVAGLARWLLTNADSLKSAIVVVRDDRDLVSAYCAPPMLLTDKLGQLELAKIVCLEAHRSDCDCEDCESQPDEGPPAS